MSVPAVLSSLAAVAVQEPPSTAGAARAVARLARAAAEPLRDLANELDDLLSALEQSADEVEEADRDDRDDAHDAVVSAADDLASLLRSAFGGGQVQEPEGSGASG